MFKIEKNDVICVIPARGGSKGLKKKNLKKVLKKKLIHYPIKYALKSKLVGTVLVSTDSKSIASEAIKAGAIVPFLRPKKLSTDLATTEATLKHALLTFEKKINKKFKICIFLTCTDIFRKPKWIEKGIDILKKKKNIESVFVGFKTHKNFWEKKRKSGWKRLKNRMKTYSSRQVRNYLIREDTGLFCASRAELWRKGKRIGDKVQVIQNDDTFSSIDIHNLDDLRLANSAMKIFNEKK